MSRMNLADLEESASHHLPLQEGVPQVEKPSSILKNHKHQKKNDDPAMHSNAFRTSQVMFGDHKESRRVSLSDPDGSWTILKI